MIYNLEYRDHDGEWKIGQTFRDRVEAYQAYDAALDAWDIHHVRLSYHRSVND